MRYDELPLALRRNVSESNFNEVMTTLGYGHHLARIPDRSTGDAGIAVEKACRQVGLGHLFRD